MSATSKAAWRDARTKYRVFRGTTKSGIPVAWASAPVATPTGLLEGRIVDGARTRNKFREAATGQPERQSTTLELADHDRSLIALLRGTSSLDPVLEYTGDSLLGLTGRLFHGYVLSDGTTIEAPITPTLYVSGRVERDDDTATVTLPLSARDRDLLGPQKYTLRVRHLIGATWDGNRQPGRVNMFGGSVTQPTIDDWLAVAGSLRDNGDMAVPFAYGTTALRSIAGDRLPKTRLLFVSLHAPDISDARDWQIYEGSGTQRRIYRTSLGSLWYVPLVATMDDGSDAKIYAVLVDLGIGGDPEFDDVWALPPAGNRLSAYLPGSDPLMLTRMVLEDHSIAGVFGYDWDSHDRARLALPVQGACGGVLTGEGTLGEVICDHLLAPWPVIPWIGLDDKLHFAVAGQFSRADRDAIAAGLTHLRPPDVFAFSEFVPNDEGERGAAVHDLYYEWSDDQRAFWGDDGLTRRAPGNTLISTGERRELTLSARWLRPDRAVAAAASYGTRMAWPTRRIVMASHDWLAAEERGALMRLTYAGGAAPDGYAGRLVRLEGTEDDEEEFATCTFEDLGPLEALRECVFDSVDEWSTGAGRYASVKVTAGSDIVSFSPDATLAVGMHLHTPGSAFPENRRIARRIVEVFDATRCRVDFPFAVSETLGPSPGVAALDMKWDVMETRTTLGRDGFLCACDETTGAFTNGTPGYTVGAG